MGNRNIGVTLIVASLLIGNSGTVNSAQEEIDTKAVAKLVASGEVKFDSQRKFTMTLDDGQVFTVEPPLVKNNQAYPLAPRAASVQALAGVPPPPPLPPPPPKPVNHTGPRPPMPVPGVPKPKGLMEQYSKQGVIVGRLQTEGVNRSNWKLAKGSYTMILTTFEGKSLLALTDLQGKYVLSFDNIFFLGLGGDTHK